MNYEKIDIDLNRKKWDIRFLQLAKLVSSWSRDPSTQTGAVITNGKRVVSVGYNGLPSCMPDEKEYYNNREEKYSRIIHCEMNALLFANQQVTGYTLYTYPFLSCDRCFVYMVQAGITRFVAPQATPDQLTRWGEAFQKVERYAKECGAQIDYYLMEEL